MHQPLKMDQISEDHLDLEIQCKSLTFTIWNWKLSSIVRSEFICDLLVANLTAVLEVKLFVIY